MSNVLVYLDDQLVDLFLDTVIAINIQKIDIGNLETRNVNYTNQIKLPFTENNNNILGFAFTENSDTDIPYNSMECRVVQNGIEIIREGIANLVRAEDGGFSIKIFENLFDIFDSVNTKPVTELNIFDNSAWNAAGIDAARLNTDGVINAVCHWGKSGSTFQLNFYLPCFFYKTFIESILTYTGLTLSGYILTDARYTDLVVPFFGDNFVYPESYAELYLGLSATSGQINYPSGDPSIVYQQSFTFPRTGNQSLFIDDDGVTWIEIRYSGDYTITATAGGTVNAYDYLTSLPLFGIIKNNTSAIIASSGIWANDDPNPPVPGSPAIYSGTLIAGDRIGVYVSPALNWDFDVAIDISSIAFSTTVDRSVVIWNSLLKNIPCSVFLKDFFNRFAVIPKQEDNVLYLKTIEEICTDTANAADWSEKRVNEKQTIDFQSTYGQSNHLSHTDSDSVNDPLLGDGVFTIDSNILPTDKTVFRSEFMNALTPTLNSHKAIQIPVYDADSTDIDVFGEVPGLRIATLKDRTTEPAITFNATPRTDYKLAYFVDGLLTKDTGFQYFTDQFYRILARALQKNKKITRYYYLSVIDIANYDPHRMVWDGEGYYIINKIVNFVPGKITKVELFKIL